MLKMWAAWFENGALWSDLLLVGLVHESALDLDVDLLVDVAAAVLRLVLHV